MKYVDVTVDHAKPGMVDAGMPGFLIDLLGEKYATIREGGADTAEPRSAETTTQTSLLEFSRRF